MEAAEAEDLPSGQMAQLETPPREKRPPSQLLQAVDPVRLFVWNPLPQYRHFPSCAEGACVPTLHFLHSTPLKECSPAWQSRQKVRSGEESLPIAHSVHAAWPILLLKRPTGHREQLRGHG